MSLSKYTEEQLLNELAKRKNILTKPIPFEDITKESLASFNTIQSLINLVEEATDEAMEVGYLDEDLPHYVYEAFIRLVYGDAFYEWKNNLPNL